MSSIPIRTIDRKDWRTPKAFFAALDAEWGFTCDVAATKANALCESWLEDAFAVEWSGVCWMNPPYGRDIGNWTAKALEESRTGRATVVALLPAKTDTRWFHDHCAPQQVRFIRRRLQFDDGGGKATFPSMVVVFRRSAIYVGPSVRERIALEFEAVARWSIRGEKCFNKECSEEECVHCRVLEVIRDTPGREKPPQRIYDEVAALARVPEGAPQ